MNKSAAVVAPKKQFAAKAKARAKSPKEVAATQPLSLGAAACAEREAHRKTVFTNKNQDARK